MLLLQQYISFDLRIQSGDDLEQGALSAATGANNGNKFSFRHLQIDMLQHPCASFIGYKGLANPLYA
ncbi:hypothetical protein D3C71_1343490 [compost metagenome]